MLRSVQRTKSAIRAFNQCCKLGTATDATGGGKARGAFGKILVANRGEIACRVMRTAKKLGVKTVAVYSEADKNSLHVNMADEAYCIGPASSSESYLKMDRIIKVALETGAEAIHPGYGFLSENAQFATAVKNSGLVFIGPPPQAIEDMGSKSASKAIMQDAGVPVVPGYFGENQDAAFLKKEAEKIGYPVLIKAVKGGGGKGMRIVKEADEFADQLTSARREALKSFGDDNVLVEKYIEKPRHVEVQVFGDSLGNYVYLFERDCSVQRRHQKVIEEAPAPNLSEALRASFGEKAVKAAAAVKYVGAGTVEFILDVDANKFYFMEMNTRLQVEHPVTEMVTGTDLVQWQLEVAAGNPLPKLQSDLGLNGWAFEARIYAENPLKQFLPDTGPLVHFRTPQPSHTVRVETGVREKDAVSVFYDPMISKLVVWGPTRTSALLAMRNSLDQVEVVGPQTNVAFLKALCDHKVFQSGVVDTGFIAKYTDQLLRKPDSPTAKAVAQATLWKLKRDIDSTEQSPWATLTKFALNAHLKHTVNWELDGGLASCTVTFVSPSNWTVNVTTPKGATTYNNVTAKRGNDSSEILVEFEQFRSRCRVVEYKNQVYIFDNGNFSLLKEARPKHEQLAEESLNVHDASSLKTPMPCRISHINVSPGDKVKKHQVLVVLEAMKMEHLIKSPKEGVVKSVLYQVGDLVEENKLLVLLE